MTTVTDYIIKTLLYEPAQVVQASSTTPAEFELFCLKCGRVDGYEHAPGCEFQIIADFLFANERSINRYAQRVS